MMDQVIAEDKKSCFGMDIDRGNATSLFVDPASDYEGYYPNQSGPA